MFDGTRIRIASSFGKLEHWSARVLGIIIIIDYYFHRDTVRLIIMVLVRLIIMVLWLVYFLSHTPEKAFYPKTFR